MSTPASSTMAAAPTLLTPLLDATPARLQRAAAEALDAARAARTRFVALPVGAPFLQVVDAFDGLEQELNRVEGLAGLFFQVHPDGALREQAAAVEQDFSRFRTDLALDREVYQRLAAADLAGAEAQAQPVARRLVEHALRDFRRAGVDREEPVRARIRQLHEELVLVGQEFARNIAGDVRTVQVPAADLAGLPEDWLAAHPAGPDGRVAVTTNPTDWIPCMKYCRVAARRSELYRSYMSRGAPANLPVLARMIALRHELATLLGYPSWAAYVTEDKMVGTEQAAREFVERVTQLTGPRLQREVDELLEHWRLEEPGAAVLRDSDRLYLMEQARRRRFDFDSREAREYFGWENVRRGVLDTAARLYGLRFERVAVRAWHPDVECYDVWDSNERRARFYLDMHPRADKYKHAAMFDLVSGLQGGRLPEACLVCNMPRPAGDDPGLLEPSDVVTLFHEFGHLLHHLLAGRQRWLAVSGIATEWDFVEVPSQFFEEWARDVRVLQSFARHVRTGSVIPAELVERMRAAQEYGKGVHTRVQMFYAALALELFGSEPPQDTGAVVRRLRPRYVPFPHEEGTAFEASFGHLEGYSALYYTYMWSLVLAKDLLEPFGGDLLDAQVASRYRRCVLEPGGSKDAAELVADFLGRPYSFEAFERWLAA
ncbi:MAG TPA: M3 family metallopeptidase [Planctomycetota bacterium]|nr:M3 family metallopeptidase [Planctomycetota bacterium]